MFIPKKAIKQELLKELQAINQTPNQLVIIQRN
jgi:hypothetical protein